MEEAYNKLGAILIGVLGFLLSHLLELEGILFRIAQWLAVLAPLVYTGWKLRNDIRNKK